MRYEVEGQSWLLLINCFARSYLKVCLFCYSLQNLSEKKYWGYSVSQYHFDSVCVCSVDEGAEMICHCWTFSLKVQKCVHVGMYICLPMKQMLVYTEDLNLEHNHAVFKCAFFWSLIWRTWRLQKSTNRIDLSFFLILTRFSVHTYAMYK